MINHSFAHTRAVSVFLLLNVQSKQSHRHLLFSVMSQIVLPIISNHDQMRLCNTINKILDKIDDLHVRLTFNLGKTNKIFYRTKSFTTVKKSILKLVELPSLVAKCCQTWKIWPRKVCRFVYICITRGKSYHFSAKIVSKVVTFSSRNTNVYKFANFVTPYFPCFTTFRHQTWQFY